MAVKLPSTASVSSALGKAWQLVGRYLKPPWMITGPVSSPEFRHSDAVAGTYRMISPASQPRRALIPAAETTTIYNIKYFGRDHRRAAGVVRTREMFDPLAPPPEEPAAAEGAEDNAAEEEVKKPKPAAGDDLPLHAGGSFKSFTWHHINDNPGEGYVQPTAPPPPPPTWVSPSPS